MKTELQAAGLSTESSQASCIRTACKTCSPNTNNIVVSLQVETELQAAGLSSEAISGIMGALQMRSLEDVQQLLGADNAAVQQLQRLFQLAEGYGFKDWLMYDASIVRGLAYYTGIVYCNYASSQQQHAWTHTAQA